MEDDTREFHEWILRDLSYNTEIQKLSNDLKKARKSKKRWKKRALTYRQEFMLNNFKNVEEYINFVVAILQAGRFYFPDLVFDIKKNLNLEFKLKDCIIKTEENKVVINI